MANANDLRKGMCIRYNGNPAIVLEVQHRTPGNLRAFVQAIIRYIGTGKSADVRFGSTDKVDTVDVERKELEFSYKDQSGYNFMDPESYETITFDSSFVGDAKDYLTENLKCEVLYVEGKAASIALPSSVVLTVTESAEGVRGDSANNVQKPATLETGKVINVPLFVKEGEKVKVSTETGAYMGRA
jgi:elongation factor P